MLERHGCSSTFDSRSDARDWVTRGDSISFEVSVRNNQSAYVTVDQRSVTRVVEVAMEKRERDEAHGKLPHELAWAGTDLLPLERAHPKADFSDRSRVLKSQASI